MRPRLTYANVVATLALFLVVGGGSALASIVISSNSQVGPNTISGHKPPAGKHANLIAGSVNGTDLANGAVTHAKLGLSAVSGANVLAGSLTGSDLAGGTITANKLNLDSVSGALQMRHGLSLLAPGGTETLLQQGPWTVTASCTQSTGVLATVNLKSSAPMLVTRGDNSSGSEFVANATLPLVTADSNPGVVDEQHADFAAMLAPQSGQAFANFIQGSAFAAVDTASQDTPSPLCELAFNGWSQ